jgi:UDP-N-acetylglucosamine:LPS N-acetylglucosamine transferase
VLPAFEGAELILATVDARYLEDLPDARFHVVQDATRWSRLAMIKLGLQIVWLMLRERPDVVFTTGALPGGFAIILGRLMGARTIWLDSIANVDEMSMTGRMVRRWAGLWLTQWPHLAEGKDGPEYTGAVL